MKKIQLGGNRYKNRPVHAFTLIDDDDFERVSAHKWHVSQKEKSYAKGTKKDIYLHRFILNARKEQSIDHINGDRLDNRKKNLRFATDSQNNCNTGLRCTNKSGYKGVFFSKNAKKWSAQIALFHRSTHLGYFNDVIEAAKAYDVAAKEHFGVFAKTNFH